MKKFMSLLLVFCLVIVGLPLSASAESHNSEDIAYPVNGGYIYFRPSSGAIVGYSGSITQVDIPSTINGISVTSIGNHAFYCYKTSYSTLKSVTIPEGVMSIGDYAFEYCSTLASVTIPDSVTAIGEGAFVSCESLTGVTIPNGVTSIKYKTFRGCSSLTCTNIPNSVSSISADAFYGCSSLKSVTIGDSVTEIGVEAFRGCSSLTSVRIPDSVINLYSGAFLGCSSLTSVTIGNGVTIIGSGAFASCSSLTNVAIGNSVTEIVGSAFSNCSSLTNVMIPDSVTYIGAREFSNCTSLTRVTIPDSVTSIESCAFDGCTSLKDIYYSGSEADYAKIKIANDNTSLESATVHYNSVSPYDYGAVHFITGWDNTKKEVTFADERLPYYVTDQTDLSFLASWPENCNTYVNVTSEPVNNLLKIEPVESHIGLLTQANGRNVTIDGKSYPVAGTGLAIFDIYVGKKILYHLLDGVIVGMEDAASMDTSDYIIRPGNKGRIYIDLKGLPGDTLSYVFTSSDDSVVSFGENGGVTGLKVSTQLKDSLEAFQGIHGSQPFYARKAGTAVITCTLEDGYQISRKVVVSNISSSAVESNHYNVSKYWQTNTQKGEETLNALRVEALNAYAEYCNVLGADVKSAAIEDGKISTDMYEELAKEMLRKNDKSLTFDYTFDDALKLYAYRAYCHFIATKCQDKGFDFSNYADDGAGMVNHAAEIISQNYSETITIDDYRIVIDYKPMWTYNTIKLTKKNSSRTYTATITISPDNAKASLQSYMNSLNTLGKKAVRNVYTGLIEDITGLSSISLSKEAVNRAFKKVREKSKNVVIKGIAVDDLLTMLHNVANQIVECNTLTNLSYSPGMMDTAKTSLQNIVNFELDVPAELETSALAKKASKALSKTLSKWMNAIADYVDDYVIEEATDYGKKYSTKTEVKCPVNVTIFDANGVELGYVGSDDIRFDASRIQIEENGDAKIIYSNGQVNLQLSGSDYGQMCVTVEQYRDGTPTGRLNYYDMPLESGSDYTLTLSGDELTEADSVTLTGEGSVQGEYLDVDQNGKVQVFVDNADEEAGTVWGSGDYVRGDLVRLMAAAEDGYKFVGWYDNDELLSTTELYSFIAREDVSLSPQFVEISPSFENFFVSVTEPYIDKYSVEIVQADGVFTVHISELTNIPAAGAMTVYYTAYDADGRLSSVQTLSETQADDGVSFTGTVNEYGCKLFLLDKNLRPVAIACESE